MWWINWAREQEWEDWVVVRKMSDLPNRWLKEIDILLRQEIREIFPWESEAFYLFSEKPLTQKSLADFLAVEESEIIGDKEWVLKFEELKSKWDFYWAFILCEYYIQASNSERIKNEWNWRMLDLVRIITTSSNNDIIKKISYDKIIRLLSTKFNSKWNLSELVGNTSWNLRNILDS